MLVRLRCRFEMMSTSRFYFSFRHEKQHSVAEVTGDAVFLFCVECGLQAGSFEPAFFAFYENLNIALDSHKLYQVAWYK